MNIIGKIPCVGSNRKIPDTIGLTCSIIELTQKKMLIKIFDYVRLLNTIEQQSFDWCSIGFLSDFVRLDTPGLQRGHANCKTFQNFLNSLINLEAYTLRSHATMT